MGCQIGSNRDFEVALRWSRGGYLVMSLTRRWLDSKRDCDSDGWYQDSIHETSMDKLNMEAPNDIEKFRVYCTFHGNQEADAMSDDELRKIREFIANVARLGGGIWCSH